MAGVYDDYNDDLFGRFENGCGLVMRKKVNCSPKEAHRIDASKYSQGRGCAGLTSRSVGKPAGICTPSKFYVILPPLRFLAVGYIVSGFNASIK